MEWSDGNRPVVSGWTRAFHGRILPRKVPLTSRNAMRDDRWCTESPLGGGVWAQHPDRSDDRAVGSVAPGKFLGGLAARKRGKRRLP